MLVDWICSCPSPISACYCICVMFQVVNEMYNYVEHFLRIPFMDYQMKFEEAVRNNPHLEVDKIR